MTDETFFQKLGFSQDDKVVIIHIDEMGFSHAANVAAFNCLDFGIDSCGSFIVPAPWFLEVAAITKTTPQYDISVHLTLTSEYSTYRWRALCSVEPKAGLLARTDVFGKLQKKQYQILQLRLQKLKCGHK